MKQAGSSEEQEKELFKKVKLKITEGCFKIH